MMHYLDIVHKELQFEEASQQSFSNVLPCLLEWVVIEIVYLEAHQEVHQKVS